MPDFSGLCRNRIGSSSSPGLRFGTGTGSRISVRIAYFRGPLDYYFLRSLYFFPDTLRLEKRPKMLKRTPLTLAVLGLMTLVLTLSLLTGCKKDEPKKVEPAPDTASVLPEPPELEPIEDAFPEAGMDEGSEPTTSAKPAATAKSSQASKPSKEAKPATTTTAKASTGTVAKPAAPTQGISKNGAYTLQIGIFNSEKLAKKRADALIAQGLPAYVTHVQDPKPEMPGLYYRVRVGSFATSAAAREYGATNLTPAGIDFWADLKGRDTQPVQQTYKPQPAAQKIAPAPAPAVVETPPAATQTPAEPAKPSTPGDTQPAPKLPDW
jgi:hypothetical protein